MRLTVMLGITLLLTQLSWGRFDPARFNFGTDWDFLGKNGNTTGSVATAVDYVTIWLNDPAFNQYWHGDMLKFCKSNDKTPVFYAYIIAKTSGLGDCDVSGGLCNGGAAYLQNNFTKIKGVYENYAQNAASTFGTEQPIIWLFEPDYFQYFSGNQSVKLSYSQASTYLNDLMAVIKKYLPNALFSLDISPWNNDQSNWINAFDMSKFSFMHTSGGRTEAGGDRIRNDNNNNVTWSSVNSASGKCIIADDGYGTGGAAIGHDATWDDINNIKNRINNGVAAITQKAPNTNWGPTINNLKSSLSSQTTKCGFKFPTPKYTLAVTISGNGSVTKSPNATAFDSGATVTLTAAPSAGYKFVSWSGDATGTTTTVSVAMTKSKNVTATFQDVNAKTKFILTITTTGAGVVEPDPKQTEFDSGSTVTLIAYTVGGSTFNGWGGALSGVNQLATLSITKNTTVSASFSGNTISVENLVKNGDFSSGETNWTFGAYEPAVAEGTVVNGKFEVALQTTGTEDWNIQLMQEGIKLKKGVKYVLSFSASATSATKIVAKVGMGADPYTAYLNKPVSLTSTDALFEFPFTMKQDPTSSDRLEIDAGGATASWKIDNISLTEAIELDPFTSVAPLQPNHQHPLNGVLQQATVIRYDHAGRVVWRATGDYRTLLRQQKGQRPGSYLTVIDIGGTKLVQKTVVIGR